MFMFWVMKAVAEIAIWLAFLSVVGGIFVLLMLPRWIRQSRCAHNNVHENAACEAICADCGKSLGFIGTWREKKH
jgi:hypothetical protein